jgi:AraC-like DNA-binding protein
MDAFSEVLSSVKLQGALYFNAEFSAPWGIDSPRSKFLAPILSPGASHLIIYHFFIDGPGRATVNGITHELIPGDIVMFPHGDPHTLSGSESGHRCDDSHLEERLRRRDLSAISMGGGGEKTHVVCGYMACDEKLCAPILAGLPEMIKVNVRGDASGRWLENSIRHLVEEAGAMQPGSDAMLAKLSEALFVDTLRRYMSTISSEETGWLAAAQDSIVGKTLDLLHTRLAEPWTLATLAKEVGLSRSSLAERFTRYLNEPPIAYLTRWRLQLGARSLLSTPRSVADIAAEVGYESEAAFNRAFKRQFGQPPARFRKQQREAAQAAAS